MNDDERTLAHRVAMVYKMIPQLKFRSPMGMLLCIACGFPICAADCELNLAWKKLGKYRDEERQYRLAQNAERARERRAMKKTRVYL